jgi:DNA polymerase I-like protein with 3'-5' exonuclease and polymerase domains
MQQGGSLSYLANENQRRTFDWRQLVKQNTYVDALPNQVDRYIESAYWLYANRCRYRPFALTTNLQNIPIRTERGRQNKKSICSKTKTIL